MDALASKLFAEIGPIPNVQICKSLMRDQPQVELRGQQALTIKRLFTAKRWLELLTVLDPYTSSYKQGRYETENYLTSAVGTLRHTAFLVLIKTRISYEDGISLGNDHIKIVRICRGSSTFSTVDFLQTESDWRKAQDGYVFSWSPARGEVVLVPFSSTVKAAIEGTAKRANKAIGDIVDQENHSEISRDNGEKAKVEAQTREWEALKAILLAQ